MLKYESNKILVRSMNHVTYRSACSLKAGLSCWAVTSQTRSVAQAASPAAVSTGLLMLSNR